MFSLPSEDLTIVVDRLVEFWPRNKTILISGGTGFIGRWILESCALAEDRGKSGNRYIIVSRVSRDVLVERIPCIRRPEFSVYTHDLHRPLPTELPVDYVIHAAADLKAIKKGQADFSGMLDMTRNIANFVQRANPRFLYISSGAVYADQNCASEESLTVESGTGSYAATKKASEIHLQRHFSNLCIARCFSFVGPFASSELAVMDMLERKSRRDAICVMSPEVIRSYMYAADLTAGLLKLLFTKTEFNIYNLGSPERISLGDLAQQIGNINPISEVTRKSVEKKSLAESVYVPDISRIQKEMPDFHNVHLQQSLEKTYQFLLKNGVEQ